MRKFRAFSGVAVVTLVGFLLSCGGSSSTPNPGPAGTAALFVATQGDKKVTSFSVNLSDGTASTQGTPVDTGDFPVAMLLSPKGDAVFLVNRDSADISRYSVQSDGTLKSAGSTQAVGGTNPVGLAADAAGKFLFVVNQGDFAVAGSSSVSVFSISGAGLTAVGNPVGAGDDATGIAVTPDGKYLFVTNRAPGLVRGFAVDANGGLTELTSSPFTAGTAPTGLAITPENSNPSTPVPQFFLYVANAGSSNVSAFEICDKAATECLPEVAGSLLNNVTGSPFSVGTEPVAILITPGTGAYLYVVNKGSNQVSEFKTSPANGVLSALGSATISTGSTPLAIAETAGGQNVFVANSGGSSFSSMIVADTTKGVLDVGGGLITTSGQPVAVAVK